MQERKDDVDNKAKDNKKSLRRYYVMRSTAKGDVCVARCDTYDMADSVRKGELGDWIEIRLG